MSSLEVRAREAADDVFAAIDQMQRSPAGSLAGAGSIARLRAFETRKRRRQQIVAMVVAIVVAVLGYAVLDRAFRSEPVPVDEITPENVGTLRLIGQLKGELTNPYAWIIPEGAVVVSGEDVVAYSTDCTGEQGCPVLWRTPPLGRLSLRPIVLDDLMLVGGQDGIIRAFPLPCEPHAGICEPAFTIRAGLNDYEYALVQGGSLFAIDGERLLAFPVPCQEEDRDCGAHWRSPELGRTSRLDAIEDLVVVRTREHGLFGFSTACQPVDGICEPRWELDVRIPAHHSAPLLQAGDRLLFSASGSGDEVRPVLTAGCVGSCPVEGPWLLPEPVNEAASPFFWEARVLDGSVLLWWHEEGDEPFGPGGMVEVPLSCFGLPDCQPLWVARYLVSREVGDAVAVDEEGGYVAVGLPAMDPDRGRILTFPLLCRTDGGTCEPHAEIHANLWPMAIRNGLVYAKDYYEGVSAFPVDCDAPCEPAWSYALDHDNAFEVTDDRVFVDSGGQLFVFGLNPAFTDEGG